MRTASGIAVVAVMSKPHRCPHIATTGNICVYCPGGPDSDFEYSTQSYTGYEPTSMRAIRARYNPYVQARARVDQLRRLGHSVDKVPAALAQCLPEAQVQGCQPCSSVPVAQVEFILMGGTFMSLPAEYRDYFIRGLHDALSGHASASCGEAVSLSEHSRTKCIGLTIETRPDFCLTPHLTQARCAETQLPCCVQRLHHTWLTARGGLAACSDAGVWLHAPGDRPAEHV